MSLDNQTQQSVPLPTKPPIWPGTIVGFVLSILSLLCLAFIGGIPAIILGAIGLNKTKNEPKLYGGKGLAIASIIIGSIGTLWSIVVPLFIFFTEGSAVLPFIYAMF